MKNTQKFLDNWIQLGHDSCHKIEGYNAEKCHHDCNQKQKSDFAKQCRKDGGLFKCCIRSRDSCIACFVMILVNPPEKKTLHFRRDKEFCDECRYCCTLSVCTTADGSRFLQTNESLKEAQAQGRVCVTRELEIIRIYLK